MKYIFFLVITQCRSTLLPRFCNQYTHFDKTDKCNRIKLKSSHNYFLITEMIQFKYGSVINTITYMDIMVTIINNRML
jgi:hypothetical protein